MVEDDDDTIEIVTFTEVTTNTAQEPVTKTVEIPLRLSTTNVQERFVIPPDAAFTLNTLDDMINNFGQQMNVDDDNKPTTEDSTHNKVCSIDI